MKHSPTVSRALAISMLAALAMPTATFAATTQQTLDQALASVRTYAPLHMDGEMTMNITTRALTKDGEAGKAMVHLGLMLRVLSRDLANPQNEGRFTIDKADIEKTKPVGEPAIHLDQPISFQWKRVGMMAYIRLEQLPKSITDQLQALKIDLTPVLGQWISIDTKALGSQLAGGLPLPVSPEGISGGSVSDLQSLAKDSGLRVMGVEKQWVGADGHKIMRLRLRLNPTILVTLQRAELKRITADDPFRAENIKDINTRFTKLKQVIAGMQMAANIDATAGTLLRLEVGGVASNPNKSCEWNEKLDREVCRNTSMTTVRYSAGFSFRKDNGPAIEIPAGAITLEDLVKKMTPPAPPEETTPMEEEMPMPDESTSGTAAAY